ncbi:MAG: molybdate ABC transporter substrate-binding protein [Candidatus Aureabacteria bacterium]|nr:molybdate ABC transporter substrate-binding protein [Candidatus Auribacterota bacterium]
MRHIIDRTLLCTLACCMILGCGGQEKTLLFFCGSAVRVPMDEIIKNYQAEKGVRVQVTYGGSGGLLSQMELARKGDVYLAGSPDYIAIGEKKKLLVPGSADKVAYLIPAIIVPKGNPANIRSLDDLARPGLRIGMGNPETVCLGLYGIELLEYNKLLAPVLKNVAVFAKSCEDTATLVVLKKVDAIIGWDVFKSWNPSAVELIAIPPDKIPRIAYIALSIPVFARDTALSRDFMDYVMGEKGRSLFNKWSYLTDEAKARAKSPAARIGGEYHLPADYNKIVRHEK